MYLFNKLILPFWIPPPPLLLEKIILKLTSCVLAYYGAIKYLIYIIFAGIFSDTHLLAMMYSGEMCYWGLRLCGEGRQESLETIGAVSNSDPGCRSQSVPLDFRETGKNMLMKYVAACEGPLRGRGWNTTTAKEMLRYFATSHN